MTKLIVKRLTQIVGIVILCFAIQVVGSLTTVGANAVGYGFDRGAAQMTSEMSTDVASGMTSIMTFFHIAFPIAAGLMIVVILIYFIRGLIVKDIPFIKEYISKEKKDEKN
jgi:hypothetical protein